MQSCIRSPHIYTSPLKIIARYFIPDIGNAASPRPGTQVRWLQKISSPRNLGSHGIKQTGIAFAEIKAHMLASRQCPAMLAVCALTYPASQPDRGKRWPLYITNIIGIADILGIF